VTSGSPRHTCRAANTSGNIRPQFQQDFNLTTDSTGVFNSTLERDIAVPVNATIEELDSIPLSEVQGFKEPRGSGRNRAIENATGKIKKITKNSGEGKG
jgi:hypothetical protein